MDSKLKKRIVLIIFLFILFITIVFNLHKIRFALGMYNIYNQDKKTDIVLEDTTLEDKIEIFNPLTSIIESDNDEDDEIVEEEPDIDEPVIEKDKTVNKSPDPKPVEKPNTTKPYVNIVKEYNIQLESLRATFESNLENLIDQGVAEYKSGISTAKLASKYLSSGTQLEKTSDKQFNSLLKEMEKELKANDHDVKVVSEVKAYYTSFKNSKKHELISKGMGYMK